MSVAKKTPPVGAECRRRGCCHTVALENGGWEYRYRGLFSWDDAIAANQFNRGIVPTLPIVERATIKKDGAFLLMQVAEQPRGKLVEVTNPETIRALRKIQYWREAMVFFPGCEVTRGGTEKDNTASRVWFCSDECEREWGTPISDVIFCANCGVPELRENVEGSKAWQVARGEPVCSNGCAVLLRINSTRARGKNAATK